MAFLSETTKRSSSDLIGETDELTAFCFDSAVMARYLEWKNKRDLMRFDQLRFLMIQSIAEADGRKEIAPPISFENNKSEIDDDESDELIRVGNFGANRTEAELMANDK